MRLLTATQEENLDSSAPPKLVSQLSDPPEMEKTSPRTQMTIPDEENKGLDTPGSRQYTRAKKGNLMERGSLTPKAKKNTPARMDGHSKSDNKARLAVNLRSNGKGGTRKLNKTGMKQTKVTGDEAGLSNQSQIEDLSDPGFKTQQMFYKSISPRRQKAKPSPQKKKRQQSANNSQLILFEEDELNNAVVMDQKSFKSNNDVSKPRYTIQKQDSDLNHKKIEAEIAEAAQQLLKQRSRVEKLEQDVKDLEYQQSDRELKTENDIQPMSIELNKSQQITSAALGLQLHESSPYDVVYSRNGTLKSKNQKGLSDIKNTRKTKSSYVQKPPPVTGKINLDQSDHRSQEGKKVKEQVKSERKNSVKPPSSSRIVEVPSDRKQSAHRAGRRTIQQNTLPKYKQATDLTIPVLAQKEQSIKDKDDKSRAGSRKASARMGSDIGLESAPTSEIDESSALLRKSRVRNNSKNSYGANNPKQIHPVLTKPLRSKSRLSQKDDEEVPTPSSLHKLQSEPPKKVKLDPESQSSTARLKLQKFTKGFDFQLFHEVKRDEMSFKVFQRFCLLILDLHGQSNKLKKGEVTIEDFLKGLNAFNEIVGVVDRVDEDHFSLKELTKLELETKDENGLQSFVNLTVQYARARVSYQESIGQLPKRQKSETKEPTLKVKLDKRHNFDKHEQEEDKVKLPIALPKQPVLKHNLKSSDDRVHPQPRLTAKQEKPVDSKPLRKTTVRKQSQNNTSPSDIKRAKQTLAKEKPSTFKKIDEQPNQIQMKNHNLNSKQNKDKLEDRPLQIPATLFLKKEATAPVISSVLIKRKEDRERANQLKSQAFFEEKKKTLGPDRANKGRSQRKIKAKVSQEQTIQIESSQPLAKSESKQNLKLNVGEINRIKAKELAQKGSTRHEDKAKVQNGIEDALSSTALSNEETTPRQIVRGSKRNQPLAQSTAVGLRKSTNDLRQSIHSAKSAFGSHIYNSAQSQKRIAVQKKVPQGHLNLEDDHKIGSGRQRESYKSQTSRYQSKKAVQAENLEEDVPVSVRGLVQQHEFVNDEGFAPITNLNINVGGLEESLPNKPDSQNMMENPEEDDTLRYLALIKEEWNQIQVQELRRKPFVKVFKCRNDRNTLSPRVVSRAPQSMTQKEFSMFDTLDDFDSTERKQAFNQNVDADNDYMMVTPTHIKSKGKKKKGVRTSQTKKKSLNLNDSEFSNSKYLNSDLKTPEKLSLVEPFSRDVNYDDELQQQLNEYRDKSTRHSDLLQRIQTGIDQSQEFKPACLSRTTKVDMSVIERIKALRKDQSRGADSHSPAEANRIESKRDETIKQIQMKYSQDQDYVDHLKAAALQKHKSMPDQTEDLDGDLERE